MCRSGLVYRHKDNPTFEPGMLEKWGVVTHYMDTCDSMLYNHAWQPGNIDFLRSILSPGYVQEKLKRAADALSGEPEFEVAQSVARDAQVRGPLIEERVGKLLEYLQNTE